MNHYDDTPPFSSLEPLETNASTDDFLIQFDDATIERALRTVSCNARDLVNYLRSTRNPRTV